MRSASRRKCTLKNRSMQRTSKFFRWQGRSSAAVGLISLLGTIPTHCFAALDPAPSGPPPPPEGDPGSPSPGVPDDVPAPSGAPSLPTTTTTTTTVLNPAPSPQISDETCEGYCDIGQAPSGCFCDSNCVANGDCCVDQAVVCASTTTTTQSLVLGTCSGGDDYGVTWDYGTVQSDITTLIGDTVTFTYSGTHTVFLLSSESAYNNCDFTDALYLGGNVGQSPFELCTSDFTPGIYYLACNIGSHCLYGNMKLKLEVTEIGPSLQAGLVEYFSEGSKTCAIGSNRLAQQNGKTIGECYALCRNNHQCNFLLYEQTNNNRCTTYKDCSDKCETSGGTDCDATSSLLRTLSSSTGTTYAVASGFATCTFTINDWVTSVYLNDENINAYVMGDFVDDLEAKTLYFSHFKDERYTLGISGQDSTPESCFDVSSFILQCSSTEEASAWNGVVSDTGYVDGFAIDTDANPDTNWFSVVRTIADTARFTYNDTHWSTSCNADDNFFECADCEVSGSGKVASKIWGCDDVAHPCLNYGYFRFEVFSSAYVISNGYSSSSCAVSDLLATVQNEVLNDCYRECARNVQCTHFFYSTEETGTVTGFVCRLYSGTCSAKETTDEPGIIYELSESCYDGRTNQDELYVDCGGSVCDQCICENLDYGNALIDGGCVPCTTEDNCPTAHYYNASFCPGSQTLDSDLNYVLSTDDTCRNCTAEGFCQVHEFWSNVTACYRGEGSVDDICQPCTAEGECPQYFYYDPNQCQGDTSLDDTCVACRQAGECVAGEFFDVGECDGTGTEDNTCQVCEFAQFGFCDIGFYNDPTSCQGDLSFDDSCLRCTSSGSCPTGTFFDSSFCQGTGDSDDSCQDCTPTGQCPTDFFFDATKCAGTGTTDDSCQPCTASGACLSGYYFHEDMCDGTNTVDDSCQPCQLQGSCPVNHFWDETFCLGTGTEDDSCQPCTTTGNCELGFYFDSSECQGDTSSDDSCVACTANGTCTVGMYWDDERCQGDMEIDDACQNCTFTGQCQQGTFFDPSKCLGTGISDDSCQSCTTSGNCAIGEYFDSSRCTGKLRIDDACQPCTESGDCSEGFFFDSTQCQGDGTTDESCVACTAAGNCPTGHYHDINFCDGTGTDPDDSCVACASSCSAGEYIAACDGTQTFDSCVACASSCSDGEYLDIALCDGTTTSDDSCITCTIAGNCPNGYYHDSTLCTGMGTVDACVECIGVGNCPEGTYYDGTTCDGTGITSTTCVDCSFSGDCAVGFYYNSSLCTGEGSVDGCVECTSSGNCPIGYFYNSASCDGSGTSDNSCESCTGFEECPNDTYYDSSQCDGTGTSDASCVACTAATLCPNGHYHDSSYCDGSGITDSSCVKCTTEGLCDAGTYYDASVCDGTGTVNSCVICSSYGECPAGFFFAENQCDGVHSSDTACVSCTDTCDAGQFKDTQHCATTATYANGSTILNADGSDFTNATSDWCKPCPTICDEGFYVDMSFCPAGSESNTGYFTDNCIACATTCQAGEYLDSDKCLGYGNSDDRCQQCTPSGSCPDGFYYDTGLTLCDGTSNNEADSCIACTAMGQCPVGKFFDMFACNGTSEEDDSCAACTTDGNCPSGNFFNSTLCDGTNFVDNSCQECTAAGHCEIGYYYDICDGTLNIDSCVACATTCLSGFYFDLSSCNGAQLSDTGCQTCTASGSCNSGFYFDTNFCDGTGNVDDSCQPCVSGGCSVLEYNSGCDGTGTSPTECVSCTLSGNCPIGFYFDSASCDGSTDEDSSCVQCTLECSSGEYWNPNKCQGDTETDDTCESCSDVIISCAECTWDAIDLAPRCQECETGYSLAPLIYTCSDTTSPVIHGCPIEQIVTVTSGTNVAVSWTDPTAEDFIDGSVGIVCNATSGTSFNVPSETTVSCLASDSAGNEEICEFQVTVTESTQPVFDNCPTDISQETLYGDSTAIVTWTTITASDTSDIDVDVQCTYQSGDAFEIGTTEVTCIAIDDAGNEEFCEFLVIISDRGTTLSPDVWGDETALDAETKIRAANDAVGVCTWESLLAGLSRCLFETNSYTICETAASSCLVLTGIIDATLSGGQPKALEFYVACDIPDLSIYGIGVAQNGGGTDGQEYTFPSDAAVGGSFLYVSASETDFESWFGFSPTYESGSLNFNGNDAIEIFKDGLKVDQFGDASGSSNSQGWDYTDGWAYRQNNTGNSAAIYGDWLNWQGLWDLGHVDALEGYSSNLEAEAAGQGAPFGSYFAGTWDPCVSTINGDQAASAYVTTFFTHNFDSNSILAYETDSISFYVLRMEVAEARAAVRAEAFSVPGWETSSTEAVPIDTFVISAVPDAVVFMSVSVLRQGTSTSVTGFNFDTSLENFFDSYIVVIIDKFDADGLYVSDEITIDLCLASLDATLDLKVLHLDNGDEAKMSLWTEVSNNIKTTSTCFSIITTTSTLAIGTSNTDMMQEIPRRVSSSSSFVFEDFWTQPTKEATNASDTENGCGNKYMGINCNLRTCPVGLDTTVNSWQPTLDILYTPGADQDQGFHSYAECSNAGICDRLTGTCICSTGREGSACQRYSCPVDRRRRICSHRGRCLSNFAKTNGVHEPEVAGSTVGRVSWSDRAIMACVCDGGYQGADCSQMRCPMAPDPQLNASLYAKDVQTVDVSSLTDTSHFVLRFEDTFNRKSNTNPIPQTASAKQLQTALEMLPNNVIPSVIVSRNNDVFRITFSDAHNAGEQHLLECNPKEIENQCESGYQTKFESSGTCTTAHDGTTEQNSADYDNSAEYMDLYECGRRGLCSYNNGTCACFAGYQGPSCTDVLLLFV